MAVNYSCFISYPHFGQNELLESLIRQLNKALANQIGLSIQEQIYLDEERLRPGYSHKESLARAICESVCMIVVYSPRYQTSDYCLREFLAMEKIEEKRAQILGQEYVREHRMIIPIVIREIPGQPLPAKIRDIQCWDLSKHLLLGFDLESNVETKKVIKDITNVIVEHYYGLKEVKDRLTLDCDSFTLPSVEEARLSWGKSKSSNFPMRIT